MPLLVCDSCNFSAKCNADYQRHLKTKKHLKLTATDTTDTNNGIHETLNKVLNDIAPEPEIDEIDEGVDNVEPVYTDNDYNEMKNMISSKSISIKSPFMGDKYTDDYQGLYSNKPTKQLGEKRLLLEKIKLYKELFPVELKDLKINENGTTEELEGYIKECDYIITSKSVGSYLDHIILTIIQQIEEISYSMDNCKLPFIRTRIKTNIKGTADLLRQNKEFYKLTKMLYIKYKCFDAIAPEWQLVILITTTALYARQKNISCIENTNFLDEEV